MIYYRILGRYGRKTHWKPIAGAANLRDGVAYVETNRVMLGKAADSVTWEVGCNVPPKDTPQARRSGSF